METIIQLSEMTLSLLTCLLKEALNDISGQ